MRGRINIRETFIHHQILLDDSEDADILVHLLPSIHFIQAELDKGRGVLVHCHAGISRSSTIVAAYLMHSRNLDPSSALELIRKARPSIDPNPGFLQQLEIFHKSRYQISRQDKNVRMFYMGRAVEEVLNGDGSLPETKMFAKFPRTPSDSNPTTPSPRRRIRCKMCRQELATREHMLDHGQLGPATPAASTPVTSRRPSASVQPRSRAPSNAQSWPTNDLSKRRPSMLSDDPISAVDTEAITGAKSAPALPQHQDLATRRLSGHQAQALSLTALRSMSRGANSTTSASALEMDEDLGAPPSEISENPPKTMPTTSGAPPADLSIKAAEILGRRLSHSMISSASETQVPDQEDHPTTHLISPNDLAAQLYAHPKLAELRSISGPSSPGVSTPVSAPILANSKCSGYFVEPMKWMEPFLESGQLAGKIICPNKKCGAKLGNYDWAGVCCGCKAGKL